MSVVVPVLLDIEIGEAVGLSTLGDVSRLQYLQPGDNDLVEEICRRIVDGVERTRSRLNRARWFQALVGLPGRASRFIDEVARLFPHDEITLRALAASQLPAPPRGTKVAIDRYGAGLLLCIDAPEALIDSLAAEGDEEAASTLRSYLGPRGLSLHRADRLRWSLTQRMVWSLRGTLVAAAGLGMIGAVCLVIVVERYWMKPNEPGALVRALVISAPLILTLTIGAVIAFRLWFARWWTRD